MAIAIIEDIVSEHEYSKDDQFEALTRAYVVMGLTSDSKIMESARTATATAPDTSLKRVPQIGDAHPTMSGLVVKRVRITPMTQSRTGVRLLIGYVDIRRRLLDIEVNGQSVMSRTELDKDGQPLVVGYKGPLTAGGAVTPPTTRFLNDSGKPTIDNIWQYSYGSGLVPIAEKILEFTYCEPDWKESDWEKYIGTLNADTWNRGEAREWFFAGFQARQNSAIPSNFGQIGGTLEQIEKGEPKFNLIVKYKFIKRLKPKLVGGKFQSAGTGWDTLNLFQDQVTRIIPTDIDPQAGGFPTQDNGNGWRNVKNCNETRFADMKLPVKFLR